MTPLEAARELRDNPPINMYNSGCGVNECDEFPHKPDCPMGAMPQIVAVLEAAEVLISVVRIRVNGAVEDEDGDDLMTTAILMLMARYEDDAMRGTAE